MDPSGGFLFLLLLTTWAAGSPAGFPPNANTSSDSSSPWASFLNLTGCQVGDHAAGLEGLKRYLQRFGYMSLTNATDDFDGSLQSAIEEYQKNFHINVSGTLDPVTIRQMLQPRCGIPDIIPTSNSSASAPVEGRHLYEFFPGTPMWPDDKRNLSYAISKQDRIEADDGRLREIFRGAFQRWAEVTQLSFSEADLYEAADIKIAFYSGSHGDGEPFDGRLGTLAHAFSPPTGIFHLDMDEKWATEALRTGLSADEIDLESVAVHEIGHLLGLGHSTDESAIMYPTITSGVKRVDLASDDIKGVQALYGSNPAYIGPSGSNSAPEKEREGAASGVGGVASVVVGMACLSMGFLLNVIIVL